MAIKGSKFDLYRHAAVTYVFSRTQRCAIWELRPVAVSDGFQPRRSILLLPPTARFCGDFCPLFWPESTRHAALFSSGLNVVYFSRLWLFLVLSSLLSTPHEMDFSREDAFYFRDVFRLQSLDFAAVSAHCFGRNLPVALPFFLTALMWLIFCVCGYFWFFRLFLVPPARWISVVKRHSIFATDFASNRSIFRRFLPVFLVAIYPSRSPFFSPPLRGLFFVMFAITWLIFCLFGYFRFFVVS